MQLNLNFVFMKNRRAIILLFLANIISGLAQGISMIAIPWYFVEVIDRSSTFTNSYLLITFLTLFWGLYAGTLIDRYSRKKLFIYVNLVCGTIIGLVALYGFLNKFLPDFLVILVFATTIFNYNIHYPNLYAFGQQITERKYYGKLNSIIEIQGQVTSVLAGAFAAILLTGIQNNNIEIGGINFSIPFSIEAWTIYEIFLLDAITYLFVIIIFTLIRYQSVVIDKINKENILERFKQGYSFLEKNRKIFIFGIFSYVLFAITLVMIHILLPSYVHDFLNMGGHVYASSEIYYSFGAIFSGFLIINIFKRVSSFISIAILFFVVSITFFLMSFYKILWLFFIGSFILGITNAGVRIIRTTFLFNNIPNNIIGRVNSVFNSFNIIMRICLIAIFSISFFNYESNIRFTYLIGGLIILLAIVPLMNLYQSNKKN